MLYDRVGAAKKNKRDRERERVREMERRGRRISEETKGGWENMCTVLE